MLMPMVNIRIVRVVMQQFTIRLALKFSHGGGTGSVVAGW